MGLIRKRIIRCQQGIIFALYISNLVVPNILRNWKRCAYLINLDKYITYILTAGNSDENELNFLFVNNPLYILACICII